MNLNVVGMRRAVACGVAALIVIASTAAMADSSGQKNKNLWRNVGIGSGALALNGLLRHNTTETVVGAAGAAYSANRYETDRHHQSQRQQARRDWAASHAARMRSQYRYRSAGRTYYSYDGHRYEYIRATGRRIRLS